MPSFPTGDFNIVDNTDYTKVVDFDASNLTTGTGFQRTIDFVDYPGTMVLADAENSGGTLKLLFHYGSSTVAPTWSAPELPDDVFRIVGSGDSSKKLAIEVDGITSTTTRTWTAADHNIVVAGSAAALTSGKYPKASTAGILIDGPTPLAGTKVYYVSDTSGGAVTRKLTFTDGILTAET